LREALARIDNDFVFTEPKGDRVSKPPRLGFLARLSRIAHFMARHTNLFLGLLFLALLGTVLANALLWQKARHPSPLFKTSIPIEGKLQSAPAATEARSEIPLPPTAPVAHQTTAAPAPEQPAAPAVQEHSAPPHGRDLLGEIAALQSSKPAPKPHDSIAQLLKSSAAPVDSSKRILAAQHALMKLGYVVRTDGLMSEAMRQALKQFERDRKLPADGTLSPQVMHDLASESKLPIQ
jgi:hypothetical protein